MQLCSPCVKTSLCGACFFTNGDRNPSCTTYPSVTHSNLALNRLSDTQPWNPLSYVTGSWFKHHQIEEPGKGQIVSVFLTENADESQ